ncbi:protein DETOXIFICATION 53-like [Gastrolobium bilobum]|uniref:protein DETOXIFICATION 53-like n=1 Tax=Gastrolobium bilobum TaxID=150636 RepID=UPI002AB2CFB0|nr:protein DETOXIFICATION 53-like [Gastrolobium bilobum]
MCTGTESRGTINADHVSKVEGNYHEDRMRTIEGVERACSCGTFIQGLLQRLHCFFTAFLPSLSVSEVKEEFQSLAKISCPIILTSLMLYSRSAISMLFLGRQGKAELAGGSLALGFANITANSVLKGLTMGMDPICCQAYGAKRWSVLNQTFFRTVCLLLVVTIPISLLWLNMEPILQMLGQDPEVTKVAKVYMVFSIPELLAQAHLHPLRTFLRTQGLTTPITIAASCAALLHLPINYFLAIYLNLGVKGIALATGLNSINMILGLLLYIIFSKKPLKPWQGASILSAFHGWIPLLSLALPSCISVCLEWWWYEIMLFLCGLLNNPQTTVATMGILIQTLSFLYVFPFSLSVALTTRIGHSLGAGQPSRAQTTAIIGLFIAFTLGISAFTLLMSEKKTLGKIFTDETQIIDMVTTIIPILGLCEISNWTQTVSCGILSGTARPYVGARINLCAFYLIGLPVSIFATFIYKYELVGLWSGMLAAQVSCFVMMVYTLIQTDWGQQSKRAVELAQRTTEQENVNDEENRLLNSDL